MQHPNTPENRKCVAGRCACGRRVIRGDDDTGTLVVADTSPVDAASELLAWVAGRPSFVLALARPVGLTLTRRTARHIKRKPAGLTTDRIVLAHDCPLTHRKADT